ncbi:DUF1150 domain-containing protein, partial [Paraburkholderia sp.]|uniref:BQ00720 family protein n=1 Tax=Paraburkholderia sp. TaxID=1926495 RepID=UPI002F41A2F9
NDMNRDGATGTETKIEFSPEALAQLGDGHIAYVKAVRVEDFRKMFPQAEVPQLEPGRVLFALHAADGTPIMLTDTREAAVANAWSHELETVSVH